MVDQLLNIDSLPIIDNHCHAALFEMVSGLTKGLGLDEMSKISTNSSLQSAFSPEEYRKIQAILKYAEEAEFEKIGSQLGLKKILSELSLAVSKTTLYEIFQRQAYQEIYRSSRSMAELDTSIRKSRQKGLSQTYIDMLDLAGISIALNNTYVFDSTKWPLQRFRWIPHLDTFIFPLWGEQFLDRGGATEDYGHYVFRHPERELIQHLNQSGLSNIPPNFSDYVAWVHQTMNRLKNEGVVAFKLLMAYFRTLDTDEVDRPEAEDSFKKALKGDLRGVKRFEDFITRDLIKYCASIDLPVQIHVGQGGPGPGLLLSHSRPMLLQNIFEHPQLRKTKIVLLHAGHPFTEECACLAAKYWNVYLDLSSLTITTAGWLENQLSAWLELIPASKILFGTDAWTPELFWVGAMNGRRVIQKCLERMVKSGFFSIPEALEIASAILYKNACRVYNLTVEQNTAM